MDVVRLIVERPHHVFRQAPSRVLVRSPKPYRLADWRDHAGHDSAWPPAFCMVGVLRSYMGPGRRISQHGPDRPLHYYPSQRADEPRWLGSFFRPCGPRGRRIIQQSSKEEESNRDEKGSNRHR